MRQSLHHDLSRFLLGLLGTIQLVRATVPVTALIYAASPCTGGVVSAVPQTCLQYGTEAKWFTETCSALSSSYFSSRFYSNSACTTLTSDPISYGLPNSCTLNTTSRICGPYTGAFTTITSTMSSTTSSSSVPASSLMSVTSSGSEFSSTYTTSSTATITTTESSTVTSTPLGKAVKTVVRTKHVTRTVDILVTALPDCDAITGTCSGGVKIETSWTHVLTTLCGLIATILVVAIL
ncbi:hypothetical protein HKX48_005189 [Thoreauomyces humboldtii]|nr:hypothetical protein HKX48_005189 [Thoreauomyces humboldtii]